MSITIVGGGNPSGPTFPVQRSVRFRDSASAYFNRTPASAGSRTTWTWSGWVKRGAFYTTNSGPTIFSAGTDGNNFADFRFISSISDVLDFTYVVSGSAVGTIRTTQVFRDPSAWYHIVIALDTTQATSSDRIKLYVNGVRVTSFISTIYPAQNNAQCQVNATNAHYIGRSTEPSYRYFDGYMTEVNFIDGQALTPTSFGAYNSYGVWSPAKYTGTYGTNGFYLNFQDNSAATAAAIGKDSSGNGNNWTPNNISVTSGVTYDSMLDVPTLTSSTNANFATLNPLSIMGSGNTLTNGNLTFAGNGSSNIITTGTFGMSSGKWYVEATITSATGGVGFGIAKDIEPRGSATVGNTANSWGYNSVNGAIANNSSTLSTGATYTTNDVVAFALDMDAGTLTFYKNNATQGSTVTGLSGTFLVAVSGYLSTINANFGQRPFSYTPPTGFKSLNTYNLPAPTIPNGATQFAATTYTGNGTTQSITNTVNGVSFQPDLVWLKQRSPTATGHILEDSVRGALQYLGSESTAAESTIAGTVTAFNSNGFSIGNQGGTNANGAAQIAWQWKANGTPAVVNTSGSIPSTISANTTSGFSIVTYTGTGANATVGHGLGIAPKMVIVKARSIAGNSWGVYHSGLTSALYAVFLNQTIAQDPAAGYWNSTAPTSTVFSIGTSAMGNSSTATYVAYCFSEIAGYSKFGSYTGNGSTDGPFVYLGFRPRFILAKRTSAVSDWWLYDTSRNTYNVISTPLFADLSNAEGNNAVYNLDLLSNGFKWRTADTTMNGSGSTYIYAAFAENPFNYSLAR